MNNNNKNKTLLVFPPFMYQLVREPYLSVPLLTGYLRRKNIQVDQRDLNAEFYHHIVNKETMEQVKDEFERRFQESMGEADRSAEKSSSQKLMMENIMETTCLLKNLDWMKHHRTYCVRMGFALNKYNTMLERVPSLDEFKNLQPLVKDENNPFLKMFRDFFIHDIIQAKYKVLGISIAMGSQFIPALTLAYLVHRADPGIHITLGGASINLAEEDIFNAVGSLPYIHSIVWFGGSKTLYELIHGLDEGKKLSEIPNVIDCRGEKPVFPASYVMPDIQDEQDPVFDETFLSHYPERYYLPVMYSIGCYWGRCSYCSNVEQTRHLFLLKKPGQFVDELETLVKKHNQKRFTLIGECLPPAFAESMADEIIKRKLDLRFWAYIRIDGKFTREIIEKLARAGCNKVTIGAESTENRILKLMKKGYTHEMMDRQVRWVKDAGIELKFNIIWDFPGITGEEALKVFNDVEKMKHDINSFALFNFSLEKNSDIGRNPGKYNIKIITDATESSSMDSRKNFYNELEFIDTKGMSRQEKQRLVPLFEKLMLDIVRSETKKDLNLLGAEDSPWDQVKETARKFLVFRNVNANSASDMDARAVHFATGERYYCYNFLGGEVKLIDGQRFRYLDDLINQESESLAALSEMIAKNEKQPVGLVKRKLVSVINDFVIP